MNQISPIGHNYPPEIFARQYIKVLHQAISAFAAENENYPFDMRSRWAYAYNPLPDDDPEKPHYGKMAALRAPNFAALRIGLTNNGQVVIEVEHRKLVTPFITNDVENPGELHKIQKGLRQIIEHFERMAGIPRHALYNRIASHPEYKRLEEQRSADAVDPGKKREGSGIGTPTRNAHRGNIHYWHRTRGDVLDA